MMRFRFAISFLAQASLTGSWWVTDLVATMYPELYSECSGTGGLCVEDHDCCGHSCDSNSICGAGGESNQVRVPSSFRATNDINYCYTDPTCGPDTWPGLCQTGRTQSPVNIDLGPSLMTMPSILVLNAAYKSPESRMWFAQNNGLTVQFELNQNIVASLSDFTLSTYGISVEYKLVQLHFNWGLSNDQGSEHAIGGRKFPLELHAVHIRSDYANFQTALDSGDSNALAVVAVVYHISPLENFGLRPIISSLSQLTEPGNPTEIQMSLRIAALYPYQGQARFARYYGSLTTPACNEVVVWTVFLQSMPISEDQIEGFRNLKNSEGSTVNYRPLQDLNGRTVKYYKPKPSILFG